MYEQHHEQQISFEALIALFIFVIQSKRFKKMCGVSREAGGIPDYFS